MLRNLMAEMARHDVSQKDLQECINCKSTKTIWNKVNGRTLFTVPEAIKIRDSYFQEMRIEYLFMEER